MNVLFLKIVNMSILASWLVLVVMILRLILKKAPRWISVLLWGLVAVRLICPFSIESPVSLIPDSVGNGDWLSEWMDDYIGEVSIIHDNSVNYDAAVAAGREPVSDGSGGYYVVTGYDRLGEPSTVENTVIPVLSVIWFNGMALLAMYTAISYWRLRRRVDTAVLYKDNIFQSEYIDSPFVMGIMKPNIYLPFELDGQNLEHVVAHEQAHICRHDHWWKPLGFLLLTIHWFNPLMWLAYVLLCRDIELACDEKVIRKLDNEQRADYTQALIVCSVSRRSIAACPLAFGEVSVKERVVSIMKYRKPAFRIVIPAVLVCMIAAVCFLTNPKQDHKNSEQSAEAVLSQVLSCTLQEAADFDAYYEELLKASAETSGTANGSGMVSVTGLEDYFQKQYGDLMTDECLENMMGNRISTLIMRLARQYASDIAVEGIELQKRSGEQDMYDFNIRLVTVTGKEQIASAAGTIMMVSDGASWKASVLDIRLNNTAK